MNGHDGRRRLLALAIGCLAAALTIGADPPAWAATTTVIERGTQYVPNEVEVAPGDTVVWSFDSGPADSPRHTVTFDDGTDLNRGCPGVLLNDCQDTPGETVQRRFSSAGTYPYYCKIHRSAGMVGVVVVSSASSSTTAPGGASTTATVKSSTTTTTRTTSSTASTTTTTRALATSSTLVKSTTTTSDTSSVLLPGAPPSFSDDTSNAANKSGSSDGGSDTGTVLLIVALLLAVSAGGGYLLWRLRPGHA